MQEALPETRFTLSYLQQIGEKFRLTLRSSYYDDWYDSEDGLRYGDKTLFDLEGSFKLNDAVTFVLGGQNIFNATPDENPNAAAGVGNQFSQFSPFGFNGAFWYARLKYAFRSDF